MSSVKSVPDFDVLEVEATISSLASGYDTSNIKTFADTIQRAIESVILLPNMTLQDSEEEIGRCLYDNTMVMVKSVGAAFETIVALDYDVDQYQRRCVSERAVLEDKIHDYNNAVKHTIIAPDKTIYDMRESLELETALRALDDDGGVMTRLQEGVREQKITQLQADIARRFKMSYLAAYDEYVEEIKKKNHAVTEVGKLEKQSSKSSVLELVLKSFCDGRRAIVQRIKAATNKFPFIVDQLKRTVTVRATGAQIANPWDGNNLTGVIEILFDIYMKRTFVGFTNHLVSAMTWQMSEQECSTNPMRGLQQVQKMYSVWERKGMWEQFSKDQFWTAVFLRGIPPSAPLRLELLTEMSKFMKTMEANDPNQASGSGVNMPLFTFVGEYIQEYQLNRQFTRTPVAGGGVRRSTTPWRYGSKPRENSETAAAASDELFNREVLRHEHATVTDSKINRTYPYVAVKKQSTICGRCYPETGSPTNPCEPTCYGVQCSRCFYYGHRSKFCRQSKTASGEDIQMSR